MPRLVPVVRFLILRTALLLMLTAPAGRVPASAQQSAPFSTLTPALSGTARVNATFIDDAWAPPQGLEAAVELPFYRGVVEVGAVRLEYVRRRPGAADFDALHGFVGWHQPVRLPAGFRAGAGFRIGLLRMTFDDVPAASNARAEHEVAADALLRVDRSLGKAWSAGIQLRYGTVMLADPLRQLFLSAGLRRTFATPGWLREVLR